MPLLSRRHDDALVQQAKLRVVVTPTGGFKDLDSRVWFPDAGDDEMERLADPILALKVRKGVLPTLHAQANGIVG